MTTIKITAARNKKYINKVIDLDIEKGTTVLMKNDYIIGFNIDTIEKLKNTNSFPLSKAVCKGYSVVWVDAFEIIK